MQKLFYVRQVLDFITQSTLIITTNTAVINTIFTNICAFDETTTMKTFECPVMICHVNGMRMFDFLLPRKI